VLVLIGVDAAGCADVLFSVAGTITVLGGIGLDVVLVAATSTISVSPV
jgi:hypothetical protein